jgi:hypothetical protein
MRRTRRSIWHTRDLAGRRSRPRSCPQWLWYFATPERTDPTWCAVANGWIGGRDRDKPRKLIWRYNVNDRCCGFVSQRDHGALWLGVVADRNGCVAAERHFGRRCDAKRWVEVESARRARGA